MRYQNYLLLVCLFNAILFNIGNVTAQGGYRDYNALTQSIQLLNTQNPEITKLHSLAQTEGQLNIWALEIGKGDTENKPGLAVIGGVDGSYVASSELALRFAEAIISSSSSDSIGHLLDSISFYIIPNVSPDATQQYFNEFKYARSLNARDTDDDRDGRINEDPYEDLNADGVITKIRIKDPQGSWMIHPDDERIMIEADKNEGEKGSYLLIDEGVDNDIDGKFNEDGPGGILFNKNLPYAFDHFTPGAGEYPVSEKETKGVLDYLYDKWNIFATITFGPSDNLSKPLQYSKSEAEQQIVSSILEGDAVINAFVSKKYNEITGEKSNTEVKVQNGGFMQWAYYHYGRLSYSTPAFFIPEIKIKPDSLNPIKKEGFNSDVNFLRWADSTQQQNYFLDWSKIDHPEFPDHEVEIGGFMPYVRNNPPEFILDSLAQTHNEFIVWLARQRPLIKVINLKKEKISKNVFRIELDVYNGGYLPALSEIGERTRWVKKPKISLTLDEGQEMLSGRPVQLLDKLPGDTGHHLTWLVKEKGNVLIQVGAPQTGFQVVEIALQ